MFDFMTQGAQRYDVHKALCQSFVLVPPYLVTLDPRVVAF